MQILCDDTNSNIDIIKNLIDEIEKNAKINEWEIRVLEAIPIDTGDMSGVGYIWDSPRQKLYEFSQRLQDNHRVVMDNSEFRSLLENIKCIDNADVTFSTLNHKNRMTILEGYIVEISGFVESFL